ncbi:death-associated protein-like 1 [Melanerpes formicivorus]|uniref:death-associated protein-like 1 n=1 Tax=Melanerpes formicivorus TaxID=211600 RepID=UPI00358F68F7
MAHRRRVPALPPLGRRPAAGRTGAATGSPRSPRSPAAAKAGGIRVPKKQENRPLEKNAKPPGKDKRSAIASLAKHRNVDVLLAEVLSKMNHKVHAAALQVAHQKPQPALEKFTLPKRIYIIQQPRRC